MGASSSCSLLTFGISGINGLKFISCVGLVCMGSSSSLHVSGQSYSENLHTCCKVSFTAARRRHHYRRYHVASLRLLRVQTLQAAHLPITQIFAVFHCSFPIKNRNMAFSVTIQNITSLKRVACARLATNSNNMQPINF